ncbi:MAG: hypothetical protein AAF713_15795 [Pseudomonadota bacterium]
MPPGIVEDAASQAFDFVMREQVVNRLYDQSVGYWEADLTELNHLGPSDCGQDLTRYFDLNEDGVEQAIGEMIAAGDLPLAERISRWVLINRPNSDRLQDLQRQAAARLRVRYQACNPFRVILYSELANLPTPQLLPADIPLAVEWGSVERLEA